MLDTMHEGSAPWGVDCGCLVRVRYDEPTPVVALTGEMDASCCDAAARACTTAGHVDVVVDMADLTFMDCAGYGVLVRCRSVLRRRGGSLSLRDPHGEPLRLLDLVEVGHGPAGALHRDGSASRRSAGSGLVRTNGASPDPP